MSFMAPVWRITVRSAKQRGDRIVNEVDRREARFKQSLTRVASATERAEDAAVALIQRHEDLAEVVARQREKG